jgi:hypothetical protein
MAATSSLPPADRQVSPTEFMGMALKRAGSETGAPVVNRTQLENAALLRRTTLTILTIWTKVTHTKGAYFLFSEGRIVH